MAMTQQERNAEDASWLTKQPMRDWLREIEATDKKMPRYLEDHIRDDHNGTVSCPYLQSSYDEKIEIRSRKP